MRNRLWQLRDLGQAIWLDSIERRMLRDGELERRIREDALTGMTSNPTLFQKALASSADYDDAIAAGAARGLSAPELFELLAADDVRDACDAFAGVHRDSRGRDGYVSIEVSPAVSHRPDDMVAEARRLSRRVGRPNVMVKVPGTEAGSVAVRRLIAAGVNVNITLLFAIDAYERVIDAYHAGLEDRLRAGASLDAVASVASFFVSRIDTEVDARLPPTSRLRGRAAIASARLAYRLFRARHDTDRWRALSAAGARLQRPVWASTSTKSPAYSDVLYVEQLIAPDTVNTMPPATLAAFRDHGVVAPTGDRGFEEAEALRGRLAAEGVSMGEVAAKLLADGIAAFQRSYDALVAGIEIKRRSFGHGPPAETPGAPL